MAAAVQVMAEQGYHHAQISRIARTAGVADGTVYLYFKNKEDILISLLRQAIGRIVEKLQERMDGVECAEDRLRVLVRLYLEELGGHPQMAMVTQVHLRQVDANIRRQIGDIMKPFYRALDDVIALGMRQGVFRENVNPRIARRLIFGTLDETVTAWVLPGGKYDLVSLADDVVDVLLHGLSRAPAGIPSGEAMDDRPG
ncbi:TetR/AcrR family transcriptional regulator [Alicyclobacillus macrosporangiidus]|nr:TetR/AcrR family transcriptional regulator [Alicyclobacillus macrosporangiidus]